jgi:hypothetical protein
LWKFTKKQILYAKYYDSADEFHHNVRCFFENINQKWKGGVRDSYVYEIANI